MSRIVLSLLVDNTAGVLRADGSYSKDVIFPTALVVTFPGTNLIASPLPQVQ